MTTPAAHRVTAQPILVEVTRGDVVESRHRVAAAAVDRVGRLIDAWGATDEVIFPRSAVKPLQAVPLLETGAAEQFRLDDAEIAIACGSHKAEFVQVELVAAWLHRLGLNESDLECGPQAPRNQEAAEALIRAGSRPSPLHNNCSGKHAAFLTTALHLGEPMAGYSAFDHPVQMRVAKVVGELAGFDPTVSPAGIDGCGIPVIATPLAALARAMARFADPHDLPPLRADALRRIYAAMTAHPSMVAGSGFFDTEVIELATGRLVVKAGAEGVYAAALRDSGLGIALKVEDGAKRAAECVMAALLARYANPEAATEVVLKRYGSQPVLTHAGVQVGFVRAVPQRQLSRVFRQLSGAQRPC